jgi:multicomponent Na+:H+ antiporter subunit D
MASLFVLLPLLGLLLVNLPLGSQLRRTAPWLAAGVALAQAIFVLLRPPAFWTGPSVLDGVLPLGLAADALSQVMLLCIGLVALAALATASATARSVREERIFSNVVLLAVIGMNGTVMVSDLFSLWLFLEVVGVASFILVAQRQEAEGLEGAFKYLLLSCIASAMMLLSLGLLLMHLGETRFEAVAQAVATPWVLLPLGLFVAGLLIKAGIVPFHGWLPDAYTGAPPAASVLLAGIVTKAGGVYALIRLGGDLFGERAELRALLLLLGGFSIVVGAFAAMGQKDMKRMLAWSSISQVGYIVLALGAGNALGLAGATFHLFNHSIFKTQLFMNAAAVEAQTGTRDMDRMGGLAERMPITGWTSVIAFLSTAGVPPLGGFWSKLVIVLALWTSGHPWAAVVAVLASLVTLAYFLSLQRRVFFGHLREGLESLREAGPGLTLPAVGFSILTVGTGLFFFYLLDTFILPVRSLLG